MSESVKRQIRDGVIEGEQTPVFCLQDSLDTTTGLQIFKHFLSGLCDNISRGHAQAKGIVTVAIEQPYELIFPNNEASSVDWFQVIDCYRDPLGWEGSADDEADNVASSVVVRDIRDLQCLTKSILQCGAASLGHQISERFAVLLDSVSSLLRFHSLPVVMNFLNGLRSHEQVSALFFLVHADLHESRVISALEYFATTIISVTSLSKASSEGFEYDLEGGCLRIRQKRRNGRVREQVEGFHLGPSSVLFAPKEKVVSYTSGKSTIPKVQFNIDLTDKEREDRAKVILPFEHQGNGNELNIYDGRTLSSLHPAAEKNKLLEVQPFTKHDPSEVKMFGEIHYLRDSDDERPDSDEDPDDDLDV